LAVVFEAILVFALFSGASFAGYLSAYTTGRVSKHFRCHWRVTWSINVHR